MIKQKNPKTIKKLIEQLTLVNKSDERSTITCFIRMPLWYQEFNIDPDKGLTLETIDKIDGVDYRFVEDDLAIVMPVESSYSKDIEDAKYYTLRLPESCRDLETDHPSEISQFILCRQFCAYLVEVEFRFSDPDLQLLLTMDTEARQKVNLQAALMFQPMPKWKDAYQNGSPLRKQLASNYLGTFKHAKQTFIECQNYYAENKLKITDVWVTDIDGQD